MSRINQVSEQVTRIAQHDVSVRNNQNEANLSEPVVGGDSYALTPPGLEHVIAGGVTRTSTSTHEAKPATDVSLQGKFVEFKEVPMPEHDGVRLDPVVTGFDFPKDAAFVDGGSFETAGGTVSVYAVMTADGKGLGNLRVRPATGEARFTPAERGTLTAGTAVA